MDRSRLGRGDIAAAGLDYRVLVATVQASQLSTATARAEGRCVGTEPSCDSGQPSALTRILLGGRDWQQAVLAQGGSFNPLFSSFAGEGNEGEEEVYQGVSSFLQPARLGLGAKQLQLF